MLRVWNLSLVDRDVLPHDPRHVPHPLGRAQLGARVHAVRHRAVAARVPRRRRRHRHRAHRVARRPAARARAHRLAGLARVGVPRQQPAVRRARVRRAARHRVPAARRGAARARSCRWGSPTSTAWPRRSASRCCSSWRSRPRCRGAPTSGEVLRHRLLVPAWIGAADDGGRGRRSAPRGLAEVLAYGLGAFATAGHRAPVRASAIRGRRRALRRVAARSRSGGRRARQPAALRRARRALRRRAHRGRARGVVGVRRRTARCGCGAGQSATVSRLHAHVPRVAHRRGPRRRPPSRPTSRVQHGERRRSASYAPAISTFPNSTEGIGTPSVRTGLVEDVYLTLVSSPNEQRRVTLGVRINPMIVWLWIGGGVMALGHDPRAARRRLRRRSRPTARGRRRAEPEPRADAIRAREEVPV